MSIVVGSQLRHYGVAVGVVIVALALTLPLQLLLHELIFALFYGAVAISAWYGGMDSGLLTTILSTVLINYFFIAPVHSLEVATLSEIVRLGAFVLVTLIISSLNTELRTAKQRTEASLLKLQASEARYRRLLDTAYEGIWTTDIEGRITYVNQRMAQMLGYPIEELLDRSILDFIKEEADQNFQQCQPGIKQQFDCCYRRQDGSDLWTIVSTNSILDEQGNYCGAIAMITDISDRKQAEAESALLEAERIARTQAEARAKALAESEAQYRIMGETLPYGMWMAEPDGKARHVSQSFLDLLEMTLEEVREFGWIHRLHPDDAELLLNKWLHCVETGGLWDEEFRVLGADGQYHTLITRALPVRDETGRITAWVGINLDINERKRMETALSDANRQITTILESITDAFISLDTEWRFTYVNQPGEQLIGKTRSELLGKNIWELFPTIHDSQYYTQIHKAVAEQVTITYEDYYPTLERWFAIRLYPSSEGVSTYFQDITKRQQEEALREQATTLQNQQKWLEAILNFLPLPLLLIEPGTARVTFANRAANEMAGGEFPKDKPGDEYHTVYYCTDPTGQPIPHLEMPGVRVARGERLDGVEIDWHTPGGVRSLLNFADTLPPLHGHPATCVLVFQDITERKGIQKALEIRLQQQAIVAQLGQQALSGIELSTLMDETTTLVAQSLDVEYCKVLELLPDGKALLLRAGVGWHPGLVGYGTVGSEMNSQAGYTLLSDDPVIVEDLRTETRFNGPPLLHDHQVISGMSVIIQGQNRPFGVLGAHTTRKRRFTEDDVNFLQAVAHVLATVIERKKGEEAVRESQELFERFMNYSPATAFIKDQEGRYLYVNRLVERLIKGQSADCIGKTDFDLFPASEAQLWRDNDLAVLNSGQTLERLETISLEDGEHYYMSFKFPLQNASGEKLVAGMSLDITDRKRLEDQLRYSEARCRRLVESNIIGICFPDLEGNILDANDAFLALVGYTREELHQGKLNWRTLSPPEYQELDDRKVEELKRFGVCTPFEKEYIHKDGTRIPILVGAALLEGSQQHTVAFILDLSDRKQAEEEIIQLNQSLNRRLKELETLLGVIPIGIGIAEDAQCRWIKANPVMAKQLRISPQANASLSAPESEKPQHFKLYRNGRELTVEELPMQYAAAHGVEVPNAELEVVYDNGDIAQHLISAAPLFDEQGQPRGCVAAFLDITERKQTEAKIRQLNHSLEQRVKERTAQLEAANQELESFSYSVSHDLRAPLRHIDGFVSLLQKRMGATLDETSQRYLNTIAQTAKQAGTMIDHLLAFSRIGRTQVHYTTINMTQLVQEVQGELDIETRGRVIHWRVEELPSVQGDPSLLRLVMRNLLENALKYTRTRPQAEITIGSTSTEEETIFFIRDNGVGFDMRYLHKLFGVFQRLHSEQEFEGSGIGLANVQRIIHRHGGKTWAEGGVDQGATFYFSLPKVAPEGEACTN